MKAALVLEDGSVFEGRALGACGEAVGELVFNTSMSGYQEVLTDPSNDGLLVAMTYPLIGSYGINATDSVSDGPKVRALIVRECCDEPSHALHSETLRSFLERNQVVAMEGVDTRALTTHLRQAGSMRAMITTQQPTEALVLRLKEQKSFGSIAGVSGDSVRTFGEGKKLALIDCGCRSDIVEAFVSLGCEVCVYPAAQAGEAADSDALGLVVAGGPGDPAQDEALLERLGSMLGQKPCMGIGLGCLLLARCLGAKTGKMHTGHRGMNQPVKNLLTGQLFIVSENMGFEIYNEDLPRDMHVSHVNLNDDCVEGFYALPQRCAGVCFWPCRPGDIGEQIYADFLQSLERD